MKLEVLRARELQREVGRVERDRIFWDLREVSGIDDFDFVSIALALTRRIDLRRT